MTVDGILTRIEGSRFNKEYRYIIMGRPGPTGKSWLTRQLIDLGLDATEISEELCSMGAVDKWSDGHNCFHIDNYKKIVIIVLNDILPKYRKHKED